MRSKFTFNHFTLITALFISSVAIWYSVAGLAAIFAASKIPIIIMGTALEIGKLVVVVWLHRNWRTAPRQLKLYLVPAVFALMFLTSMGIFGFLSKAHVEQTAQSQESVAQVKRIETEIARHNAIIERSEQKIKKYEEGGSGADAAINAQIDKEQKRVDSAYDRVKPVIQTQRDIIEAENKKIETRFKPYQDEVDQINADLKAVEDALRKKDIRTAQRIIGTNDDGRYGTDTITALKEFRTKKEKRRKWLLWKIDSIKSKASQASLNAQEEIKRINESVKQEIQQSQKTINQLRSRLGKQSDGDVESLITAENTKIKSSNVELDTLTQEKYKLQAEYRKLEAEVGPIKYIAEFVYGEEADENLLEKAVTWVIILIIFVFDPLAVLLLIASQYSFEKEQREQLKDDALDKINDTVRRTEEVLHEAETVEHNLEDLIAREQVAMRTEDLPADVLEEISRPLTEEEFEKGVPEENKEADAAHDHIDDASNSLPEQQESEEPWEDLNELDEIAQRLNDTGRTGLINITKVSDGYVNFNGKVYKERALSELYPELDIDFEREVRSGAFFPNTNEHSLGIMFLRTDKEPTELYIFNGQGWDKIDKNVLKYSAYTREYIKMLIAKVGNGSYNPELLNEFEKQHIEALLSKK